jgi:hypothetical protein
VLLDITTPSLLRITALLCADAVTAVDYFVALARISMRSRDLHLLFNLVSVSVPCALRGVVIGISGVALVTNRKRAADVGALMVRIVASVASLFWRGLARRVIGHDGLL